VRPAPESHQSVKSVAMIALGLLHVIERHSANSPLSDRETGTCFCAPADLAKRSPIEELRLGVPESCGTWERGCSLDGARP